MTGISLPQIDAPGGHDPAATASALARDLAPRLDGEVRTAHHDRMLYATDASIYQVEPLAVVLPRHERDLETVVSFCAERGLPILPRGAGTSLAGQAVNAAVIIDFSRHLNRIIAIDGDRQRATVQPGVVLDRLNEAAATCGLMFGPDVATSSHANLGGMIGNNSAGVHSILYGRTVEHLLALDVILANGTRLHLAENAAARDEKVRDLTQRLDAIVRPLAGMIRDRYPTTRRRVNGYNLDLLLDGLEASSPGTFDRVNLAHLVCGSEGTLAVTAAATVKLVPRPRCRGLLVASFGAVDAALAAVAPLLDTGPAAVELIDDVVLAAAARNDEYRRYVELLPAAPQGRPGAVLYIEFFGDDRAEIEAKFDAAAGLVGEAGVARFTDDASMVQAWKLRKAGEPLLHGLPGRRKPVTFIEDLAVDPSRLAAFVQAFRALVARHGTQAAYYAHASVGCLHMRPLVCLRDEADRAIMQSIATEATDLVREFGGALSGEHGDGRARSHLLERFYGPEICAAFAAVKSVFDPEQRLNPGNIVGPPAMDEHLRVRPAAAVIDVPAVTTFFRYEREHGFAEAAELCNGAGVCRRETGGTMCPSYRATREERHATRGRGNALRLAITGQLARDGRGPTWSDPETLRTLDLCLSCKACKTECPSNVDIARLKAEYLAQGYKAGARIPRAARAFGNVRRWNRRGSTLARLANVLGRGGPARWLASALLGIDRRRSLPPFAPSLYRWFERRRPKRLDPQAPSVVMLPDCFSVYNEPHLGRAAVSVLERLGYRAILPRAGCCGRAMISQGLLDAAVETCRETAQQLMASCAAHGAVAVVGLEPSCVSAITDDWIDLELGLDPATIRTLAAQTTLVETFIESRWDEHPIPPRLHVDPAGPPILLHGHCHQKALWGLDEITSLLRRCAGDRLTVLDSGCCGLAGAFGYTRDHYDLSMAVGELALFPAVRTAPTATVLAPGTSCRHQLRDGTGVTALHPIELIAAALAAADDDERP